MIIKLIIIICTLFSLIEPISASNDVVIGYFSDNSILKKPYITGYEGLGFELFEEIKRFTDYDYTYVEIEDENEMLFNGRVDIVGPVFDNQDERFFYNKNTIGQCTVYLVSLVENIIFNEDTVIYVREDAVLIEMLLEYLVAKNINCSIKPFTNYNDKQALYVVHDLQSNEDFYEVERLQTIPFYFKSLNEHYIDDIDFSLLNIKQEAMYFYESLYLKYHEYSSIVKNVLTPQEIELLQQNQYVVGYSKAYVPVSYVDENYNPKGIAIEIMDYIKETYNIDIIYQLFDENTKEQWDLSVSVINDHIRDDSYLNSESYYEFSLFLVENNKTVKKDIPTMGLFDYLGYEEAILQQGYDLENFYSFDTIDEMANALYRGDVDYVITTNLSADLLLKDPRGSQYSISPINFNLNLPIIFNNHITSSEIHAFKKIIQDIPYHTIASIVSSHGQSYDLTMTLDSFLIQYETTILFGFILFILFIASFIFALLYHRQLMYKKALQQDPLTKGFSIHHFIVEVEKVLHDIRDDYALISINLQQFQYISEIYGYHKSKEIIVEFYEKLVLLFGTKCIARTNDDSFVILIHLHTFQHLDLKSLNYFDCLDQESIVYCSVGVFNIEQGLHDVQYMIDNAISARNQNNKLLSNEITYFNATLKLQQSFKNKIVSKMEDAIIQEQFKLYFQPKINIHTNTIMGCEALVRWHSVEDGIILPSQFIPVFEDNHFIEELDFYVVKQVFKLLEDKMITHRISINISGYTFSRDDFIERVKKLFDCYSIDGSYVEFELTESIMVEHFDIIKGKIKVLQALGFVISIDDFGSGSSSLGRLSEIDVDVVKIDRMFVRDIENRDKAYMVLLAMSKLVSKLGVALVVEGVETLGQIKILKQMNIECVQGFYYAKPLILENYIEFVKGEENE